MAIEIGLPTILWYSKSIYGAPTVEFPQNMAEVLTRQKDIQYSSRTRANTDRFKEQHQLHHAIAELMKNCRSEIRQLPEAKPFKRLCRSQGL